MKVKIIIVLVFMLIISINVVKSEDFNKKINTNLNTHKHSSENSDTLFVDDSDTQNKNSKEPETLSRNNGHSGGYGALTFKGSKFKDSSILLMGIRGAWIVNSSFGLGIDLNGVIPVSKYDDVDPEGINKGILLGGYGGMLLEPVIWSNKIVHLAIPISLGAGWLGYIEDWENSQYYYGGELYDQDVFWYIEPGLNAEINVTKYFRVNVGISKRFTQDLNLINTPSNAFDKINYMLALKFGGF